MKKIALLLVLTPLLMGSCKKEYQCSCTQHYDSGGVNQTTTTSNTVSYVLHSKAKKECEGKSYDHSSGTTVDTYTCTLQ
jgi:hypothetical protein